MSGFCLALVAKHHPATRLPLAQAYPQYVLLELSDTLSAAGLDAVLQGALADAERTRPRSMPRWRRARRSPLHCGAARKHSPRPRCARVCKSSTTSQSRSRASPSISPPPTPNCSALFRARAWWFSAISATATLHHNVAAPEGGDEAAFVARAGEVSRGARQRRGFSGSISAEHGLGQHKREEILRYKITPGNGIDAKDQGGPGSAGHYESG